MGFRGRTAGATNLFAGVAVCSKCGGNLVKQAQNHGRWVYLMCSNAARGLCSYKLIRYDWFKEAFVGFVPSVEDLYRPLAKPKPEPSKLNELEGEKADAEKQIAKIKSLILSQPNPSTTLVSMLTEQETRKVAAEDQIEQETVSSKGTPKLDSAYWEYFKKLFSRKLDDHQHRLQLREAIRGAVENITVNLDRGAAEIRWKNLPETYEIEVRAGGWKSKGLGGIEIAMIDS